MIRFYPSHSYTVSWISYLNVSNETLYIHPRALELSVKTGLCNPGPSCCMLRYIDVSDARNYSEFSVKTPWGCVGMYQLYARPFLL